MLLIMFSIILENRVNTCCLFGYYSAINLLMPLQYIHLFKIIGSCMLFSWTNYISMKWLVGSFRLCNSYFWTYFSGYIYEKHFQTPHKYMIVNINTIM